MTSKSHLILTITPLVYFLEKTNNLYDANISIPALIGALVGSLLPDIDEPNSYMGRQFIFISEPLKLLGIKHRTWSHSIFFIIPFIVLGLIINPIFYFIGYGIFMHILEDMITNSGVPLFYPLIKKRIGIRIMNTNSFIEHILSFGCLLELIYIINPN